jgi:hypothetical protein
MDEQKDALKRINLWLDRLEENAREILDSFQPDDLSPAQAVSIASKFITIMARLLEIRQQFTTEAHGDLDSLLTFITKGTFEASNRSEEPEPEA